MKKQQLRVAIEQKDFEGLKVKADALGVSVATYSRIVLKKNADE